MSMKIEHSKINIRPFFYFVGISNVTNSLTQNLTVKYFSSEHFPIYGDVYVIYHDIHVALNSCGFSFKMALGKVV